MGTLIFHPGIGKTATSAIQEIGTSLPVDNKKATCFSPFGLLNTVHNALACNHPQFDADKYATELEGLFRFIKSRKANTVVSSEFLIRSPVHHVKSLLERCQAEGVDVKVVFVIRNYSDYLISSYLQAVKVKWGMRPGEDLLSYADRELQNIRLTQLIDKWARFVGDSNIFILDYDQYKADVVDRFFEFVGVKEIDKSITTRIVNPSIPLNAANILLEFDKVSDDAEKRLNLIHLLSRATYRGGSEQEIKNSLKSVVKNAYQHDLMRLKDRYNFI